MTGKPLLLLFNPSTWRGVGDATAPWGLISLATRLPDVEIHLVDQRFDTHWQDEVRTTLRSGRCLLAGATAMTGLQLEGVLTFFRLVRTVAPHVPTIMGGVHASMLPLDTVRHPDIDYVLVGEGEEVLRTLIDALAAQRDPVMLMKAAAREGAEDPFQRALVHKGSTDHGHAVLPDLDAQPLPPHHRFPMERYVARTPYGRTLSVLTSRGCPHGCAFCLYSNPQFASRWRALSAEKAVTFMEELAATYDVEHFHVQDDNFFVRTDRVRGIVELLRSRRPGFTWTVGGAHVSHMRRLPESFFKELRDAGCLRLLIGAESGSEAILERIGKRQSTEDVLQVNRHLLAADIRPIYSFISGVPDETDEDLRVTIRLMDQLRQAGGPVDVGTIKPLVFYPGTTFYQWALDRGFQPPETVEGWSHITWDRYLELPYPWLSQERRRFLLKVYYTSLLWNPDYHWVNSSLFTLGARALMPLTRYRMRHLDFRLSLLPDLLRIIQHRAL